METSESAAFVRLTKPKKLTSNWWLQSSSFSGNKCSWAGASTGSPSSTWALSEVGSGNATDVATDPDRLARFEREARVLASLNHVNVATLHGLERDGDTGFLVMELVEGDTLADRIARSPLSPQEAIPIFIEIAQGLEAAHERGVIHRDLKPANIKLGGAGEPLKILDFGLAKAAGENGSRSGNSSLSLSLSLSPTLTLAATQRGEVMGTAAYMSPEQAKGLEVDRRTDVWAFGACLFEALCGERAFAGKDASELMASVLAPSGMGDVDRERACQSHRSYSGPDRGAGRRVQEERWFEAARRKVDSAPGSLRSTAVLEEIAGTGRPRGDGGDVAGDEDRLPTPPRRHRSRTPS